MPRILSKKYKWGERIVPDDTFIPKMWRSFKDYVDTYKTCLERDYHFMTIPEYFPREYIIEKVREIYLDKFLIRKDSSRYKEWDSIKILRKLAMKGGCIVAYKPKLFKRLYDALDYWGKD